jgi:hypothetical protein
MSDTQSAAPQRGMQRIPLPLESYEYLSPPLTQKRLLNFYAEQAPGDSRTAAALVATPGLFPYGITFGDGPVTALNCDEPGIIYAVSGTHFWRATLPFGSTTFVVEDLGEVGTPSGADYPQNLMPTIASGITGCVVCIPPNAFTCTHGGPLNQIGGDFPGANSVTYLDGYWVFTSNDIDGNFFCSRLLDPNDYDALDFAYTDAVPNVARRVMTLKGQLWFMGDMAAEVWYDAGSSGLETTPGTSFFPFRRQAGGVIPYGTDSIKTCAILDGSMFWVARNGTVFRSVGYQAQRISTHSIEEALRRIAAPNAVCGLAYIQGGHSFYCVTYGTTTLVYDVATKVWHERSSAGNSAWLPISIAQYGDGPLFGPSNSGRIQTPIPFLETDDGVLQTRLVQLPPLWGGTSRAFCARLEIEMELGQPRNPAAVQLEWSDDGGYTWVPGRIMTADNSGRYRKRVFTTRLGSFRQRTFRLVMQGHTVIYGVDADITGGAH